MRDRDRDRASTTTTTRARLTSARAHRSIFYSFAFVDETPRRAVAEDATGRLISIHRIDFHLINSRIDLINRSLSIHSRERMSIVSSSTPTTTPHARSWTSRRAKNACRTRTNGRSGVRALASNTTNARFALLFDCDGVIVETEELHRLAYNGAFEHYDVRIDGVLVDWVVEYYDVLQNTVGGGKPKMKWHFTENKWPTSTLYPNGATTESEREALIDALQDQKTVFYKKIVEEVAEARPGILALMDEAIADPSIAVGICSAATKAGFEKVVNSVVGRERLSKMDVVMAGDDVTRKKPDPLIYNLAREKVGLPASKCVVVEDSLVGLRAAVGANMNCVITPTQSTASADFMGEGAKAVFADLSGVRLAALFPLGASEPNFKF